MSRTYRKTPAGKKYRRTSELGDTRLITKGWSQATDWDLYNKKSRRVARDLLRSGNEDIHVDVRREWIN